MMEGFDEETKDVIQQIHLAWKSKAVLPEYAILRNRVSRATTQRHNPVPVETVALEIHPAPRKYLLTIGSAALDTFAP